MTTTTYPRSQHWTTEDFRVTVMVYKTNRGPCATCGRRPARHATWADGRAAHQGFSGGPADYCDEHRPARGTLPDLPYRRITGGPAEVQFEHLTPVPGWPCDTCGGPSVIRRVARCDGCDDESRWAERTSRVISGGESRTETQRYHETHETGEWFRCAAHPFPAPVRTS